VTDLYGLALARVDGPRLLPGRYAPLMLPPTTRRSAAMRGSPRRVTDNMEQLQTAYAKAVCAAAGCGTSMVPPTPDEGIDIVVTHRHESHTSNSEQTARLEIQMKSTSLPIANGLIEAKMSRERFDEFSIVNPELNRIVVIMSVPKNQAHWVFARPRSLTLHHCAYWVNLAGATSTAKGKVTIHAPISQDFDDLGLCDIMSRIGQGGRP